MSQSGHTNCKNQTYLDSIGLHLRHLGHPLQMLQQALLGEVILRQKILIDIIQQPPPRVPSRPSVTRQRICASKVNQQNGTSISCGACLIYKRNQKLKFQTSAAIPILALRRKVTYWEAVWLNNRMLTLVRRGVTCQLCHLLAMCIWACHLISVTLKEPPPLLNKTGRIKWPRTKSTQHYGWYTDSIPMLLNVS